MASKHAIHPGIFIKEELEEREWSQRDLAYILGCPEQSITAIISGKRNITPEMAKALAIAFDVSPELFTNLQQIYDLSKAKEPEAGIEIRKRIQSSYPAREMLKRGWLTETKDPALLEAQFIKFFDVDSLEKIPHLHHAAKKSYYDTVPPAQLAWLFRVKNLAQLLKIEKYNESKLRESLEELRQILPTPEEIRRIPKILTKTGVRFIIVESIRDSKIDGVCFWLDENSPVIGMSLRFDRIDNFWFVLRHEIEHVLRKDGQDNEIIDTELQEKVKGKEINKIESIANKESTEFIIHQQSLLKFISETQPYYSEKKILSFSNKANVHPGVLIGQLQGRKEISYAHFRKYLVKIRCFLVDTAFVDGWGNVPKNM